MTEEMDSTTECVQKRRKVYKPNVATAAGERRRSHMLSLSREKREILIDAKRRCPGPAVNSLAELQIGGQQQTTESLIEDDELAYRLDGEAIAAVRELQMVLTTAQGDLAAAAANLLATLRKLRQLMSEGSFPPLLAAVRAGAVPLLVQCLQSGISEDHALEAAWCLTNIASGGHEESAAVLPAVPSLMLHLGLHSSPHMQEQCAWALSNLAGDSMDARSVLLHAGAMAPLANLLLQPPAPAGNSSIPRLAAWAISNLLKGPDGGSAQELMRFEGMAVALLRHLTSGDGDTIREVAWVLTFVTAHAEDEDVQALVERGILSSLLHCLCTHKDVAVQIPVMRTIANVCAGCDRYTDALLAAGSVVPGGAIHAIVSCIAGGGSRLLERDGAWALSNIAAGTLEHKEAVARQALPQMLHCLATAAFDIRKEAAFAIGNVCMAPRLRNRNREGGFEGGGGGGGEQEVEVPGCTNQRSPPVILRHLEEAVDRGCLPGFINLVRSPDPEAARLGLTFLEMVLRALPNKRGVKLVEEEDGIDAIESLAYSENKDLSEVSNALVDKYYGMDYGLDDDEGAPGQAFTSQEAEEYPPWRKGGSYLME